jgi:hypothetical protein
MVCYLGAQHEAKREDHCRMWSQPWDFVSQIFPVILWDLTMVVLEFVALYAPLRLMD